MPNHALILLALIYSRGDFHQAMTIVNTSGWDTDCNSGNVGCLIGIMHGLKGLEGGPDWRGPLADRALISASDGGYAVNDASYQFQRATEAREKITVGANEFVVDEPSPNILYIGEEVAQAQTKKLNALRARRSNDEVRRRLEALKNAAAQEPKAGANGQISPANTMPFIVEAVKAYATVGEICEALREVYGTYTETAFA